MRRKIFLPIILVLCSVTFLLSGCAGQVVHEPGGGKTLWVYPNPRLIPGWLFEMQPSEGVPAQPSSGSSGQASQGGGQSDEPMQCKMEFDTALSAAERSYTDARSELAQYLKDTGDNPGYQKMLEDWTAWYAAQKPAATSTYAECLGMRRAS